MTIFSPKPKDFYKHCGFGLANTKCSFELWNLLSLSSRSMFAFENGLLSDRLPTTFDKTLFFAAESTVNQSLGGKTVMSYMRMNSPWYFYKALLTDKYQHLKLDKWHEGGFLGLVKARCLAWESRKLTKDEKGFILMHSQSYQP